MNPVYLPSAYMYLSVAIWNKKNEIDVWDLQWTEIYILALPILIQLLWKLSADFFLCLLFQQNESPLLFATQAASC